jgi:hypothetical protein
MFAGVPHKSWRALVHGRVGAGMPNGGGRRRARGRGPDRDVLVFDSMTFGGNLTGNARGGHQTIV